MTYKLFLDDVRLPGDVTWVDLPKGPWVIVRNYDEFCRHIVNNGMPEFISFDHDLADEHYRPSMYDKDRHYNSYYGTLFKEATGYECAKWLVERCMFLGVKPPEYAVHTKNPIGYENIVSYIENYKRTIHEKS